MRRFGFYFCICAIFCGTIPLQWGCGGGPGEGNERFKDGKPLLRIAVGRDLYDGPDSRSFVHGSLNAWESLTYLNERLQPRDWLAESWHMENGGRTWVFRLKEGVTFHDGTPLTQSIVVSNILRYKNHPKYDPHGLYRDLLSVRGIGERGVVFHFGRPYPNFPASINYFGSAIFQPDSFDSKGQFVRFAGTGPYCFETNKDGIIRLKAHSVYWQGRPPFETVEFWFIPDAATRLNALQAGQVDAIVDVGGILPNQLPDLRNSKHITLKNERVATTHYLLFNCQRPPFNSISNRKWVSSTLDRMRLVKFITGEAGIPADSLFTPIAEEWQETFFPVKPPSDRLTAPVAENELSILLHGGTLQRWPYKDIAEAIHAHLLQGGWKARIRIEEAGSFKDSLRKGNFDLALHPFTLMTGDPDIFYTWLSHVSPVAFGHEIKNVNELVSKARYEIDKRQRKHMYRQLQKWVSENSLLLPLYHDVAFYAHRDHIDGLKIDAFFRPNLMEVKTNRVSP